MSGRAEGRRGAARRGQRGSTRRRQVGGNRRPRRGWRARLWRWRRLLLLLGVLAVVLVGGLAVIVSRVELPPDPPQARTSFVVDAGGRPLGQFHAEVNRVPVTLQRVARVAREAVLAAEDRGFYRHSGLSPRGILRALWADVRGQPLQGGSTITQQLVKNAYLGSERSLARKLREAVLALKVEQVLSKDTILERYLNTVYFGRGAYGIEAAARAYFGVPAEQLDLPQAALLAGLIRSPERTDPALHPEDARRRRNEVLGAMGAMRAASPEDIRRAMDAPLGARARTGDLTDAATPGTRYLLEEVRQQLVALYGEKVVYGGGLRVELTIDLRLQQAAEAAVASVLDRPEDPEAALVALDTDGRVRALVGGRDFTRSKVDLALGRAGGGAGRQPGSSFKPFVLAAALEQGLTLRDTFPAPPVIEIPTPPTTWRVENFDGETFPPIDLVGATAHSVNTVYAQLMSKVGPTPVVGVARRLGITSPLQPLASLALGSEPVSPYEMATAYATFANRGARPDPFLVARVTDASGHVLLDRRPKHDQAIDAEVADAVNLALRQVVEQGTGKGAAIGRPAAGKTGTTQDFGDAWFVGYTPQMAAAVWMGYPEGQSHTMTDVHGRRVTGGSFPAEIWRRFMVEATRGVEVRDFTPPPARLMGSVTTTSTTPVASTTTTTGQKPGTSTVPTRPASTTTARPKDTHTKDSSNQG